MSSQRISPNNREIISAQSTITGQQEYLTSKNGFLNVNAQLVVESIEIGKVDQGLPGVSPWLISGTVISEKLAGTITTSTNVSASATVVTLLASNINRIKATIYNDSTAILYVKEGSLASLTSFDYFLNPGTSTSAGGLAIIDDYNGVITGIWASAVGNARIGETTP